MFNPQMKDYKLYKPVVVINELGEKVITHVYERDVKVAIAVDTKATYEYNDTDVLNVQYAGLTKDTLIAKGDMLDMKYYVEYVEVSRLYTVIHMKEVANSGKL